MRLAKRIIRPAVNGVARVLVLILEAIDPLLEVRFVHVSDRFGHMIQSTDLYLRRRAIDSSRRLRLHMLLEPSDPSNRQLMTMIGRRARVIDSRVIRRVSTLARSVTSGSKIWDPNRYSVGEFYEVSGGPPPLDFTPGEHARGSAALAEMGIGERDAYVCFSARDKAYLSGEYDQTKSQQWDYHDYRDCDIQNYVPAAEYLASRGLFALRMGAIVETVLKASSLRIVDYSTHHRSDFLDIYLGGTCRFFLGDTSGIHCIAQSFNIPVAAANWIPLGFPLVGTTDMLIPKRLWSIDAKRFLTLREIIRSGADAWIRSEQYEQAGIEPVQNSPEEILSLAREMNDRIDGTWVAESEDEELQERYRGLFPPGHYAHGSPSLVGAEFLRENREWLD